MPWACTHPCKNVELVWQDGRAVAIKIPRGLFAGASGQQLKVVLAGPTNAKGILGDFAPDGDNMLFKPLIPLSAGMAYRVISNDRLLAQISVPVNTKASPPVLLTIYPESDTLPENQLKLYLHFSKPMRTGQALEHITLLNKNKDTIHRVFLNLQPELWDTSGTVLTLWLDPGRIKRDLVLNRQLGNPLIKMQSYQLMVDAQWKDTRGLHLKQAFTKQFTAGPRDGQNPDIRTWQLNIPRPGGKTPLTINTGEPLDHYLLLECISVLDSENKVIEGNVNVSHHDRIWQFTPAQTWQKQTCKIRVKAILEDLAGNNLNRVFDRDLRKDKQQNQADFERVFEIK